MMIKIFLAQYGLTLMILAPLIGAVGLLCLKGRAWSTLMCTFGAGLALVIGAILLMSLRHVGGLEFSHEWTWIPQWNVTYWVAVDGMSFYLLLVTLLLIPVLLFIEAGSIEIFRRRAFFLLIFEAALLGVYLALDLFLFIFCLELASLSLFLFLGCKERNLRGLLGRRFLLLNLIGSGLLLMAIVALYEAGGGTSHLARLLQEPMVADQQTLWCGFFIAGMAIKGALLPWHAWFRDLEARLDPGLLIAVNGLYLPVAGYALIRFAYTLLPYGFLKLRPFLFMLALVSLVLAGLWAWGVRRRQSVLAYVSLAMAAWMILGVSTISSDGLKGTLYLMGQHAWIMALFATVLVLQASQGVRAKRWILLLGTLGCLAVMAFPGSSAFVSFILIGGAAFREQPVWISFGIVVWISVGGLLFRERGAFLETCLDSGASIPIRPRPGAWIVALVLASLVAWGGLHPEPVLKMMQRDGDAWLARLITAQENREDVVR